MIELSSIKVNKDNPYGYTDEEVANLESSFKALPVNTELTTEQLRTLVLYNRMQREGAFNVGNIKKKTKTQLKKEVLALLDKDSETWTSVEKELIAEFVKEYTPKKLSRKAAEVLLEKDKLNLIEEKDLERTIKEYKPRKLSQNKLGEIVSKGGEANPFEKLDLEKYLLGE